MTSDRQVVMLAGRLIGMGRDVECTVSATKASLPGTDAFEYARLGIHSEPPGLPDGRYQVRFAGRTVPIERYGGAWISRTC